MVKPWGDTWGSMGEYNQLGGGQFFGAYNSDYQEDKEPIFDGAWGNGFRFSLIAGLGLGWRFWFLWRVNGKENAGKLMHVNLNHRPRRVTDSVPCLLSEQHMFFTFMRTENGKGLFFFFFSARALRMSKSKGQEFETVFPFALVVPTTVSSFRSWKGSIARCF